MQPGQQPNQYDPTLPPQPTAMPTPTPLSSVTPPMAFAQPTAPTPQFGQQMPQISMNSEHHFPLWVIAILVVSILGAGALLACVIVFMR